MDRPLRRHFYRPREIVIGYDEHLLDPAGIAAAREAWVGSLPVRSMPFRRAEPDPASPLLITFGDLETAVPLAPPPAASAALARCLADAGLQPLRMSVRVDDRGVIVRGQVSAADAAGIVDALADLPALATQAREAISRLLPDGAHLVIARFDETTGGRWTLTHAHGFSTAVWRRPLAPGD